MYCYLYLLLMLKVAPTLNKKQCSDFCFKCSSDKVAPTLNLKEHSDKKLNEERKVTPKAKIA